MSVTVDGYVTDRDGGIDWGGPDEEQLRFHTEQVSELGAYLVGRRLYETMLPWETDPTMRGTPENAEFADLWASLPKVVFSRSLDRVEGNARLATGSLAEEVAAALAGTDQDVAIGGADLAGQAIELDLVDELRPFRYPVLVGGGTPFLPSVGGERPLELVETRIFAGRVVFERYRRIRGGARHPAVSRRACAPR